MEHHVRIAQDRAADFDDGHRDGGVVVGVSGGGAEVEGDQVVGEVVCGEVE